jgi:hypothetical protein
VDLRFSTSELVGNGLKHVGEPPIYLQDYNSHSVHHVVPGPPYSQSAMASDEEHANEHTPLLPHNKPLGSVSVRHGSDAQSILSSHLSKDELALGNTAVGERLPYNDYTTIDWLHDLVRSNTLRLDAHCD